MSAVSKQELIERCEYKIKQLSKVQCGIMHRDMLDLLIYCHAIASLTKPNVDVSNELREVSFCLEAAQQEILALEVELARLKVKAGEPVGLKDYLLTESRVDY